MKKFLACLLAVMLSIAGCQTALAASSPSLKRVSPSPESLLEMYAPVIWFSKLETTWPSSIEEMELCSTVSDGIVTYNKPWLDLKGNLKTAKCYAFYCEKSDDSVSLVYWQFYLRDPGKLMIASHYGDWEHCSVKLEKKGGVWTPTELSRNYHGINQKTAWDEVELCNGHPVVYAARGSHGLYLNTGLHRYQYVLFDMTDKGIKWETQNSLEGYRRTKIGKMSGICGENHLTEFETIKYWGQSDSSPDGPLDYAGVTDPGVFL